MRIDESCLFERSESCMKVIICASLQRHKVVRIVRKCMRNSVMQEFGKYF